MTKKPMGIDKDAMGRKALGEELGIPVMDDEYLMRQASDMLREALEDGKPLPAYLERALLKYAGDLWKRVDTKYTAAKAVDSYANAGAPRAKGSNRESAFHKAAKLLGVSASAVERWVRDHPLEPDLDQAAAAKNLESLESWARDHPDSESN